MYYEKHFTTNNNNLKNIWLGIKEIINVKSKNYDIYIIDPLKICNSFNDYFSNIADDILKKRKVVIHLMSISLI